MDGFPTPPWFIRAMFAVLNAVGVSKKLKNSILANGFKPGTPTAPDTVPRPDAVTDQAGVQLLSEVVERIKSHRGVLHPSPLFGDMDRELFIRVTLLHAQHHLGFLEPKSA